MGWSQISELHLGNSLTSPELVTKSNCVSYQKKVYKNSLHKFIWCQRQPETIEINDKTFPDLHSLRISHFIKKKNKNQKPGSSEITAWPSYKLDM